MTITAQRLLTELGQVAWSGFSADDMEFSSTDSVQARAELKRIKPKLDELNQSADKIISMPNLA